MRASEGRAVGTGYFSARVPAPEGTKMELQTRQIGETLLIQCSGRIVAGDAAQALQAEVKKFMLQPLHLVLHLGEVSFLDSSGLGTLVRLVTNMRAIRRNLCLCCLPEMVRKTLTMTNTLALFEVHETEVDAIRAAHRASKRAEEKPESANPPVLCLEQSADVRAYLGELLRRSGYWPLASGSFRDALTLQKAVKAKIIVVGGELLTAQGRSSLNSLAQIEPAAKVIELEAGFSQQHAGEAAEKLLESLRSCVGNRS
jgi:anti-sigma B factor antagonist